MTGMIALSMTPAICAIAAMFLALNGRQYAGFLWVALICAFFISGVVSGISP